MMSPVFMQAAMMIFGIVHENDNVAARVTAGLAQLLEEVEEGIGVEYAVFPLKDELAVAQPDGAKVSHALASGVMEEHGVFGFRGYPHTASGAMLLEVDFIN